MLDLYGMEIPSYPNDSAAPPSGPIQARELVPGCAAEGTVRLQLSIVRYRGAEEKEAYDRCQEEDCDSSSLKIMTK